MAKKKVLTGFSMLGLLFLTVFFWACAGAPSKSLRVGEFPAPEAVTQSDERLAPAAPLATAAPKLAEGGEGVQPLVSGGFLTNQMVVYTANITLVVKDVEQGVASVEEVALWAGGYVSSSNLRQEGKHKVATMTIRVPAERYRETMSRLRQLAVEVKNENANARDVGEEYADLDAQVKNLEATEARYIQLLQKANTIDEILRVQRSISEVRDRIDRIRGRINYLERQSDYATIILNLQPEALSKGISDEVWDPLRIAQEAWEASLRWWQGVATFLIRFVIFAWWLGVIGLVIALVLRKRSAPRGQST